MKAYGWIYVVAYGIDGFTSLVATLVEELEPLSSVVSVFVGIMSIAALVLACTGDLAPRKVFLAMSGFYVVMLAIGVFLGVYLAVALGPSIASQGVTPEFLREQIPWYDAFRWTCVVGTLALAGYGLYACLTSPAESSDDRALEGGSDDDSGQV